MVIDSVMVIVLRQEGSWRAILWIVSSMVIGWDDRWLEI